MTLTLPPELEAGIERELATGRFETPVAVMAAALEALSDSTPADREHFEEELQESMDSADRGELYDEVAVRAHLKAVRAKR
jgi:Arc/MetJ-type ribon-helix-helix transcriptional regulator